MSLIKKLLKVAGKDELQLDSRIGKKYLFGLCLKYGGMMLRGKWFSLGNSRIHKNVFVGKKVKILEKRYLTIGEKTKIHDGVYIDALSREGVLLGNQVVVGRNTRIECTGSLSRIGKGVRIGDRSTFGNDCFFGAAGGISIGADVVAGQFIRFHSENHNFNDQNLLIREQGVTSKGIKVGNNCWIGSGAVFLDGVEVGDGCVIAANAVVTRSFPANSIIAGIPAKRIRNRGHSYGHDFDNHPSI